MQARHIAILSAVGLAGLVLAITVVTLVTPRLSPSEDDQFAACRPSTVAGGAETIGGPFELINGAGETVTDAEILTEPALIYFGYTFCPDVCPFDVARNADAVELLEERGIKVTPVFISVDPARDTPEVVSDFAEAMHPRMIGLTGSPDQISQVSQAYRTYYKVHDDGDPFYLVDHSTFSYLVLPGQGFVEFFRRETDAEEMADRMACFIENA